MMHTLGFIIGSFIRFSIIFIVTTGTLSLMGGFIFYIASKIYWFFWVQIKYIQWQLSLKEKGRK